MEYFRHGHSSSQSGALIGHNDDLLIEIFLRLPVTSILRFKSVSKHWRSLLSDRRFTLQYDGYKPSKSPGLFFGNVYVRFDVENRIPPSFPNLDFCFDPQGIKILQSCNGLMLCCSNILIRSDRKYYVFNPTTNQFAIIPSVPGAAKTILLMGLAFHPTDCVSYKLVCIRRRLADKCQILIYSSDTRKWKIRVESFSMDMSFYFNGVYWNGAIHWFPLSRTTHKNHLYFKLEDEQLLTMPTPMMDSRYYDDTPRPMYFGESRGHLHLVSHPRLKNRLHLNVYEMLGDHSGWFVKYQAELDEVARMYTAEFGFFVSDVVRGEKEEDTFIVINIPGKSIPGKIIKYNVHDKSFVQIFSYNFYEGSQPVVSRYTPILGSYI